MSSSIINHPNNNSGQKRRREAMPRKSKNTSASNADKMSVDEENEYVSERGTWSPEDTDNFHWVLSKHTHFESDKLILNHRYLDPRDISIVEKIEAEIKAAQNAGLPSKTDKDIVDALELANEANTGKNCSRIFALLRELQVAAGGKHSVRQINTKHINTRSRWSIPFQSLHEVGYLIKNQSLRSLKRADSGKSALSMSQRTNIEKKNLAAIKAILKFVTNRSVFWNDQTNSMPMLNSMNESTILSASSGNDEMAEPERWIRAMIRRHGYQMVGFMEKCVVNLANSYIAELQERGVVPAGQPMFTLNTSRNDLATTIGHLVDEVVCLPKPSRKPKNAVGSSDQMSVSSPLLDIVMTTPVHVTQAFADGDAKSLGLSKEIASASSPTTNKAANATKESQQRNNDSQLSAIGQQLQQQKQQQGSFVAQSLQKETSPEQDFQQALGSSYNAYDNDQAFSFGSQVKRSQSLLFSDSQLSHSTSGHFAAQAHHQQQQQQGFYQNSQQIFSQPVTSNPHDLTNYGLSSYTGISSAFANPFLQGSNNNNNNSNNTGNGNGNGNAQDCKTDDRYLGQFVNLDGSSTTAPITSNMLHTTFNNDELPVFTDPFANSRPIITGTPQSDLLEAIVNLSVNGMQPNAYGHSNAFNNLGDSFLNHQDYGSQSMDQTPTKIQRIFNGQLPNGFPQRRHSQMSVYEYNLPHKLNSPINIKQSANPGVLGRTLSDEQSAASSSVGWMPDEPTALANNESQPTSSAQQPAFTFQLPYSWSDESVIAESFPKTPGMQTSGIPIGSLQTSFSTSNLSQIPLSIDISSSPSQAARNNRLAGRKISQRRSSARPALGTMPLSGTGQDSPVTATNSGSNSATSSSSSSSSSSKPNVSSVSNGMVTGSGKSKTTTNLIIINGVASHIELIHDNSDVNPNPIVLPISKVIQRDN